MLKIVTCENAYLENIQMLNFNVDSLDTVLQWLEYWIATSSNVDFTIAKSNLQRNWFE